MYQTVTFSDIIADIVLSYLGVIVGVVLIILITIAVIFYVLNYINVVRKRSKSDTKSIDNAYLHARNEYRKFKANK